MTNQYLSRIKERGGETFVFCRSCDEWKPADEFHMAKGKFKSTCKDCHRAKYSKAAGYQTPSAKRKQEQAAQRREAWLAEIQQCTICGGKKPRRDYYDEAQKRYLPYCCSTRRTYEQVEIDIRDQEKTCFECGLRLPFDDFSNGGNGRDGKRPYCKCCEAARLKMHSDRADRVDLLKSTDDGTATVSILSKMLRETECCQYCGVKMTQDYPVTPYNKTIDHNVPLSRGGKHTLSNISIMCFGCNSAKGQRTLGEFARVKKKRVAT